LINNSIKLLEEGFQTYQAGNFSKAEDLCRQALIADPKNTDGLNLLSIILSQSGNTIKAIELLEKAVQINTQNADFFNNLGQLYKDVGKLSDAIKAYSLALKVRPNFSEAHSNLGNAFAASDDTRSAMFHYNEAIQIDPKNLIAQYNLATTLSMRSNHSQAIKNFRTFLDFIPDHFEAHNNIAYSLLAQGSMDEAMRHLKLALKINPNFCSAFVNLGYLFAKLSDWESSIKYYKKATGIDPNKAESWTGLGNAQDSLGKTNDALVSYRLAVDVNPEFGNGLSALCNQLMETCAWEELALNLERLNVIENKVGERKKKFYENPLMSLTRTCDLQANAQVAWYWSDIIEKTVAGLDVVFPMDERRQLKPILNIGYLSSDFRNHVVGNLVQGLFALHNREKFHIKVYSSGVDDRSINRRNIKENCDEFININSFSSVEVAQQIYDDQIDILVDLNGHTVGGRLEVSALRPAPIQINYLGFPGTVGNFFDYIILDKVVLEPNEEVYFCEKVIYVPPYYVVNDQLPEVIIKPRRKDFDLPDESFVFCSFNKANKIEPVMFKCWMNILKKTPGSVLWLIDNNSLATLNLKQSAVNNGVSPERLIFAKKLPRDQHIARHQLANLVLDTRLYNGGATTWDALSTGLPVLTLRGQNVPSRASASMLTSLGMEELITFDIETYEELALNLAVDQEKLENIRGKIIRNMKTSALFNAEMSVNNIEMAYQSVWESFARSIEPHSTNI
jgi:protein O-GlcNAc transferase